MINCNVLPKLAGVYKVTNLVNGKIYIGKSWNIQKRIKRHIWTVETLNGAPKLEIIHTAMKKYGLSNFEIKLLEVYPSLGSTIEKLLLEREAFWIFIYQSHISKRGYNICARGTVREGSYHHQNGRPINEKTRLALLKSNSYQVIQIDLNTGNAIQEFKSLKSAALSVSKTHRSSTLISDCLKGKIKSAFGFYWAYKNEKDKNRKRNAKGGTKTRVNQIDPVSKKIIQTWDSIAEAAKTLSIFRGSISKAICGKIRRAGGFFWEKSVASFDKPRC